MINVSGLKVWPAEVEAILHSHPNIKVACIVADPHERTGESVRAVIVPKGGSNSLDLGELKDWCRQNMADYRLPKVIEIRESLSRSGAGKVLWREL